MNLITSRPTADHTVGEVDVDSADETARRIPADLTPSLDGADGNHTAEDDGSGFDDEPLPPRRQKVMTPLSWVLVAGLLAGGGFAAGAHFKKTTVVAATASTAGRAGVAATTAGSRTGAATATTVAGAAGATGAAAGAGAAASGATTGTVKLIDGTSVYVQDNQGNVIKIATTGATTVNVTKPGAITDFKPGDTIVAQGPTGTDGTVNATSISSGGGFSRGAAAGATGGATATTPATGASGSTARAGAATPTAPRPATTTNPAAGG